MSAFSSYYTANCMTGDFKSINSNEIENLRSQNKIISEKYISNQIPVKKIIK